MDRKAAAEIAGIVAAVVAVLTFIGFQANSNQPAAPAPTVGGSAGVTSGPAGTSEVPAASTSEVAAEAPEGRVFLGFEPVEDISGGTSFPRAQGSDYSGVPGQFPIPAVTASGQLFERSIIPFPNFTNEYLLGRGYQLLGAVLGVDDYSPPEVVYRYLFSCDGELIADETVAYGELRPISVSVAGCLRLTVTSVTTPGNVSSYGLIGDPLLTPTS